MNCPVCEQTLVPVQSGDLTVDACVSGCGGIWFDAFELQQLRRQEGDTANVLIPLNLAARPDFQPPPEIVKRRCPKCDDAIMMRHYFSRRKQVMVDECPSCGGFWIDAGELALIRGEFEADAAAKTEPPPATVLNLISEDSADLLRRAQTFDQICRLCASIQTRSDRP